MNKVQIVFTSLLSDAINNVESDGYQLSKAEWIELYKEAIAHQVEAIIFSRAYGMLAKSEELGAIAALWKRRYLLAIMQHKQQCMIVPEILKAFNEANIAILMLKGYVIKDLYRNPDTRLMGDLDFLVEMADWEKTVNILKSLGYDEDLANEHGCAASFKHATGINIELHRKLAEESLFPHIKTLEKAFWDNATSYYMAGQHILIPARDDFIFYLFLHLAKHFASSGFGFRQLADLTLFIKKNKDFLSTDVLSHYIDLFELRLITTHILKMCNELLDLDFNLPVQDITQESYNFFVQSVFEAGVFGYKTDNNITDNIYLNFLKHEFKSFEFYILKRIFFPPAKLMNTKYSYARNYPALLPVAWIHRGIDSIRKKRLGTIKLYGRSKNITKLEIKLAYLKQFNLLDRPSDR